MIEGLKPYPAYKDSGIPWVGGLPSTWRIERGKWLFRKMSRPIEIGDEVVTCFRDGTVTLRKNRRLEGFTESLKEIGYQRVHRGDLVIHAMDAFAGAIGVSDSDGKCTPVYSICEPIRDANPYYYAYIVREMARTNWILALATGIRERSTDFRFDTFASQFVPLPPADEQAAIVRFLDHADRRIRRYIGAKRRLIALLNEQKLTIIHRAVKRGLDSNVQLKHSGIDWLGDIPKHWEVRRNGYLFSERIQKGSADLPLLAVSLRTGVTVTAEIDEDGRPKRLIANRENYKRACTGDLAYNMMRMWQGAVGVVPTDGLVSPAYVVARPHDNAHSPYYELLFRTSDYKNEVNRASTGIVSDRNRLYWDDFKQLFSPCPPLLEQRTIAQNALGETAGCQNAIDAAFREIALLQEYRTRMTTDVVTGKLDIRDAAAQLPVGIDEQDVDEADALVDGEEMADDEEFDAEPAEVEA